MKRANLAYCTAYERIEDCALCVASCRRHKVWVEGIYSPVLTRAFSGCGQVQDAVHLLARDICSAARLWLLELRTEARGKRRLCFSVGILDFILRPEVAERDWNRYYAGYAFHIAPYWLIVISPSSVVTSREYDSFFVIVSKLTSSLPMDFTNGIE